MTGAGTSPATGLPPRPTFTFLVHPLSEITLRVFAARGLKWGILRSRPGRTSTFMYDPDLISRVTRFPRIISDQGPECTGEIVGIPTLPKFMLEDQGQAVDLMAHAATTLGADADLIGLGALCAIVGSRGQELASRLDRPVTTGNSLTCWAASETTQKLFEALEATPRFRRRICVVGYPGTMAAAIVEVLAARGLPVELYARRLAKRQLRWLDGVRERTGQPVPVYDDLDLAVRDKGIVVGAGSIGGELAAADLRHGTIVVDVAQPLDTTPAQRERSDLLVVEGEMVSLPVASGDEWRSFWSGLYNLSVGQVDRRVFACLAEPMVLCLEDRAESFSLGRTLDPEKVEEIGAMARRHGFGVRDLFHGRTPLPPHALLEFASVPWLP
jgi:3-acetyloctanal aminotransferase